MLFSYCERDEGWGGGRAKGKEKMPLGLPQSILFCLMKTKGLPSLQATMANDQCAILKPFQP